MTTHSEQQHERDLAEPVVRVEGLVKNYGSFRALSGLDLRVGPGEVHGFLGPNGAGKSTTIRILLGLLGHDSGTAEVFGLHPRRDALAIHRRIAYVPGDVNLWPALTGGEVIDLFGRMRANHDRRRRDELVDRFDLDPTKRAGTYSKGNRQKVALVSAFSADADLLVLDEPTSGLDPLMERVFTECVREARERGCTILLSSHILSEVEKLCERVSIIRAGRTVQSGSLDGLRARTRTFVDATTRTPATDLAGSPGVTDLESDGLHVRFAVDAEHLDGAIACLGRHGLVALTSTPPALEDLFLEHYSPAPVAEPAAVGARS
ncbi:ABC transporter ATP-binding protein [Rhodococcus triatomae]|uniref:ABC-2 type transport system ATP-binding protein n=1 Tax=Rhodococcus triatomae TaxID=300028 RepID=A0A1G7ZQ40_9NOCA|nr:ABC transporter ATP-binding protein [Rhodococcus triatomae]QNG17980.1 ABC transporter ATP-binding protein [Rhodococcus triatomae]QNG22352.1 ABC transporter ATP-binding protein [Rhodococcus triatomae]SDH10831.1 ABC-2 type transport system ATP-binding protein [Rhodococcus triatomae]